MTVPRPPRPWAAGQERWLRCGEHEERFGHPRRIQQHRNNKPAEELLFPPGGHLLPRRALQRVRWDLFDAQIRGGFQVRRTAGDQAVHGANLQQVYGREDGCRLGRDVL